MHSKQYNKSIYMANEGVTSRTRGGEGRRLPGRPRIGERPEGSVAIDLPEIAGDTRYVSNLLQAHEVACRR